MPHLQRWTDQLLARDHADAGQRASHTTTRTELEESKRDSSRSRIASRDDVPSGRLAITLDTSSSYSSKIAWSHTNKRPLESRLPDVLTTFERWALVDAESTEAMRLAEIEAQKRRERDDELARVANDTNRHSPIS